MLGRKPPLKARVLELAAVIADAEVKTIVVAVDEEGVALAKERPDHFERSELRSAMSERSAVSEWNAMSEEACAAQRRKDAEREG